MRRFRFIIGILSASAVTVTPAATMAQIISITIAPPALPVYVQPAIPEPGFLWTPGYWAYGPDGYFWVPGTWVRPPTVGLLWTPGYWGWRDGIYAWNGGYWGNHVGFYGGVSYGFGYGGVGYEGGLWRGGVFSYNSTVNNFGGVSVTTYSKTIVTNNVTNVSFNGGTGGTAAQPTAQEQAAANEPHTPPTTEQTQHQTAASTNKALLASVNHGSPAVAATSKPGEFTGKGVVAARSGPATGFANTGKDRLGNGAPKGPAPGNAPHTGTANALATGAVTPAKKELKPPSPTAGTQAGAPKPPPKPAATPKIAATPPHPPGGKPPAKKPPG